MDEEAVLIVIKNSQDDQGFPVEEVTEYPVYVRVKSVRFSEFYQALNAGYTPRLIFEMRNEDWEQTKHLVGESVAYATKIRYDGGTYGVLRYYRRDKSMIQITCGDRMVGYGR